MIDRQPVFLIVDDKRNMLRLMAKVLKQDGSVRTAESGGDALRIMASEPVDVVLCDLMMPDMNGLDVLRAVKRLKPAAELVLMTAYASVGTAVEALKLGAYDYLTKPFEPEHARSVLLRALSRVASARPEQAGSVEVLPAVIAQSRVMQDLAQLVRRVADGDVTTLVLGETGTGKERIARAVHELSPRAQRRFVAVNCAAIPNELLESELFGHQRGAFTGASSDRKGLFEEAHGGSLFLDEIGDLRPSLQAKLTRVLEERMIRRVGETKERPVDVRVIAATHRDLEAMVEAGTFREDLFYRLNVALLRVPPLSERREDIALLAHHFLQKSVEGSRRRRLSGFTQAALELLQSHDWPGNVRQLRSAVERASLVAASEQVELSDLPPDLLRASRPEDDDAALSSATWDEALERGRAETGRRYLTAVMRRFEGQVAEAAQHAGVERESFYRLLRKHGVEPSAFRPK
jgi:two-component system response regulator HydG